MLNRARPTAQAPRFALFSRPELRAAGSGQRLRLVDELFLQGLSILQLGFSRSDSSLLVETLTAAGARNVATSEQVIPLGFGKLCGLRYDGLLINLDRYADVEAGIDQLMRFRRACPACFVVMATSSVASDDFGQHRRAICDSTLRLPLSARRVTEALRSSLSNNRGLSG